MKGCPRRREEVRSMNWNTAHQFWFYASIANHISAESKGLMRVKSRIMGAMASAHSSALRTLLLKVKREVPTHSHAAYLRYFGRQDVSQCELYRAVAARALAEAKGLARIPNIYKYLHSEVYLHLARDHLKQSTPLEERCPCNNQGFSKGLEHEKGGRRTGCL